MALALAAQQGQATQLEPWQIAPELQVVPPQQAWPTAPQLHTPDEQVKLAPQAAPLAQHGWPRPPQTQVFVAAEQVKLLAHDWPLQQG